MCLAFSKFLKLTPSSTRARKVKCDEARPNCLRCQTSNRICAGYRTVPRGSISWNQLLRVQPSTIPSSTSCSAELRGLDFFRRIVAPALASPLANAFWARPVFQLAIQDPATRHAVLAISSFYERFDPFAYSPTANEDGSALRHYNKALGHVAVSRHLDADTVLLISILFTCIEFLRGDATAAIQHCRHGTHILRSIENASPEMLAIFRHLSIFPFFFGATLSDFPLLRNLKYPGRRIDNVAQAAETLDCLMSSSVRLVRAFDPFRLGTVDLVEIPPSLLLTQYELCQDLDTWQAEVSILRGKVELNDENQTLLRSLEMRWLVCKIWVRIASCSDEMTCDTYQDQFERIVELAREDAASKRLSRPEEPSIFKFEMGLSPLLHFVVLKCRFLRLRLEALALLKTLSCARESLWDTALMYGISSCIIAREHGIELSSLLVEGGLERIRLDDPPPPSDSQRIRDSYLEDEMQLHVDCGGSRMTRRRIVLFVRNDTRREVVVDRDWIYLPERS